MATIDDVFALTREAERAFIEHINNCSGCCDQEARDNA